MGSTPRPASCARAAAPLTQQLVKNFFLSNERSLSRKINEAMMAVLLELHYDKRDILESYLNEVFLGQDGQRAIHGFGPASQYFFSQPLAELKLDQVALLVGMVKGPSYFNPRRYPDRGWRGATWCSTCSPSRAWRPSRKSTPPSSARSA